MRYESIYSINHCAKWNLDIYFTFVIKSSRGSSSAYSGIVCAHYQVTVSSVAWEKYHCSPYKREQLSFLYSVCLRGGRVSQVMMPVFNGAGSKLGQVHLHFGVGGTQYHQKKLTTLGRPKVEFDRDRIPGNSGSWLNILHKGINILCPHYG
jgi:hypothetical protein